MGYMNKAVIVNRRTAEQTTLLVEPTLWAVCDTAASEPIKQIQLAYFTFVRGVQICVRFENTNSAQNPQLRINDLQAKDILYGNQNTNIPAHMLVAGINYNLVYNGTAFEVVSAAVGWATPSTVYVDLENASNTTQLQGGKNIPEVLGVNGVLPVTSGGTGHTSHEPNRLVWSFSDTNNKIHLNALSHYADSTHVAINSTSTAGANFEVYGTTQIIPNLYDTAVSAFFKIGGTSGRFLSIGADGIQAFASVNDTATSTLYLQASGGNLIVGEASQTVTGTFYGQLSLPINNGLNYSGISAGSENAFVPIWFSKQALFNGENDLETGVPVYSTNFMFNAASSTLQINGSITSNAITPLQIIAGNSLVLSAATGQNITFKAGNSVLGSFDQNGTFIIGNPMNSVGTNKMYIDGSAQINGNVMVHNLLPETTNTYSLGDASHTWNHLYLGTSSSYGDAYTPVYWNNDGLPAVVNVVQKNSFVLDTEHPDRVVLNSSAYNTNTITLAIVITSGGQFLQAPLSITAAEGSLTISTTASVTGTVAGYIITARGIDLSAGG